jgi:hypothetical protein
MILHIAAVGCGHSGIDTLAIGQKAQAGIVGQREPGRVPERSSRRCQIASTTGPPVSTGAHGSFGGKLHATLAFLNNQRLPSSRELSAAAPLAISTSWASSTLAL